MTFTFLGMRLVVALRAEAYKIFRITGKLRIILQMFDVVNSRSLPHPSISFAALALILITP